jgi:hypothetical protein
MVDNWGRGSRWDLEIVSPGLSPAYPCDNYHGRYLVVDKGLDIAGLQYKDKEDPFCAAPFVVQKYLRGSYL